MHVALVGCPFGVESWEVGPGLLTAWRQTVEDRLPADALTRLSARIRPRWDSIVQIDCDHLPLAPRGYDLGYYMAFGVHWRLDGNQPSQPVEEAAPFITRQELAAYPPLDRWQLRCAQASRISS